MQVRMTRRFARTWPKTGEDFPAFAKRTARLSDNLWAEAGVRTGCAALSIVWWRSAVHLARLTEREPDRWCMKATAWHDAWWRKTAKGLHTPHHVGHGTPAPRQRPPFSGQKAVGPTHTTTRRALMWKRRTMADIDPGQGAVGKHGSDFRSRHHTTRSPSCSSRFMFERVQTGGRPIENSGELNCVGVHSSCKLEFANSRMQRHRGACNRRTTAPLKALKPEHTENRASRAGQKNQNWRHVSGVGGSEREGDQHTRSRRTLGSIWGRARMDPGSIWVTSVSSWGQVKVFLGPSWGHLRVETWLTWAHSAADAGSRLGVQFGPIWGVGLGAIWGRVSGWRAVSSQVCGAVLGFAAAPSRFGPTGGGARGSSPRCVIELAPRCAQRYWWASAQCDLSAHRRLARWCVHVSAVLGIGNGPDRSQATLPREAGHLERSGGLKWTASVAQFCALARSIDWSGVCPHLAESESRQSDRKFGRTTSHLADLGLRFGPKFLVPSAGLVLGQLLIEPHPDSADLGHSSPMMPKSRSTSGRTRPKLVEPSPTSVNYGPMLVEPSSNFVDTDADLVEGFRFRGGTASEH